MKKRINKIFFFVTALLLRVFGSVKCTEYNSQPKIRTFDGNIIIEAVKDRNISFNLLKGSTLFVNDNDVYDKVKEMRALKNSLFEKVNTFEEFDEEDVKKQLKELRDDFQRLGTRLKKINRNSRIQTRNATRAIARIRSLNRKYKSLEILLKKDQCRDDITGASPCQNGGTCYNTFPKFYCDCLVGWSGKTCDEDVDECREFAGTDLGCQNNALCENTRGSYSCKCKKGYFGTHCRTRSNACESGQTTELCEHGVCVHASTLFGYSCICDDGWTKNNVTPACSVDVDECQEHRNPCHSECINLPGSFKCASCPIGYTGNGLVCTDINECEFENGGCSQRPYVKCFNSEGSYHCGNCPQGWTGDGHQCEKAPSNSCDNEKLCHPQARCEYISDTVVCTCPLGMYGHGFGLNGCTEILQNDPCERHECKNNGTCVVNGRGTTCVCPIGYFGYMCEKNDACNPSPCQNGGTCGLSAFNDGYRCSCGDGTTGRNCEVIREICDSIIREEQGELNYPTDNSSYQAHENCPWIIYTHPSKILNVTFTEFNLESSLDCHKDWLQIHDGSSIASQLIGRFCGNELPLGGNILSSHHKMLFWFHSDNVTHGGGFKFNWISQNYVCGDDIYILTSGVIRSPGYPDKTPINRECEWKLTAPYGYRVVLRLYEVNLGQSSNCSGDTLKIYDSDLELKKFCESGSSEVFRSSSNEIVVHFHTDYFRVDSSFQMHYEVEHGIPHCGGLFTEPTGIVNAYVDANVCLYLIRQPIGTQIQLDLERIHLSNSLSCRFQKLEIFDGDSDEDPLIKRFCGTHDYPEPITSKGNTLLLRYENSLTMLPLPSEFKANYKRVCEYRFFGPDNGTVATPNYPQAYIKGLTCTYDLYGPANFGVVVNILDFSMTVLTPNSKNANGQRTDSTIERNDVDIDENINYLDVIPWKEPRQRYYENPPMLLTSRSNHLRLVFHMAERSLKARGMKFEYKFIETVCGGILTAVQGNFRTFLRVANDCQWIIQAPLDKYIKLRLHLLYFDTSELDCGDGEYGIFIYDNSTSNGSGQLLNSYCSTADVAELYSTNIITIQKRRKPVSHNLVYIKISYEFVNRSDTCGGEFKTKFGIIKSPFWPKPYGLSRNCSWHIMAPMGYQIELKVHNFSLEQSFFNCLGDSLEIRNGPNEKSPLIGKYCGNVIPKRIPSLSNNLYVSFTSDEFFAGDGFYITWERTATGCGGKLNSHEGSIHSPHDNENSGEVACDWEIIVAKGSTVILTLLGEDICTKKHVLTIYDGLSNDANNLEPNCTIKSSTYILQSTANQVLVRYLVNDSSMDSMQFIVDYKTNCQITLDNLQGVIESPNFPDNYPPNISCAWDIRAGKKDQISLAFSHLNVERGYFGCTYDYIDIVDMRDDAILSEQRLCRIPTEMLITQGNRVVLKFVSDHSRSNVGFRLEYKRMGCGEHLYKNFGALSTPNAPYSIDMNCEWYIEVAAGYQINLNFNELKIETDTQNCSHDGILVAESKNSNNELLRECIVNDMVISLVSPANRLYVHFYSSERHTKKYFSATYTIRKAICGGSYRGNSGFVASPSFFGSIQGGIECKWNIEVENGFGMELKFKEFNITETPNCTSDYLEIKKYTDNKEIILNRACGEEFPNIKLIHGNSVGITLKLSDKGWGKFSMNYVKQCGGVLTSPSGFIKSQPGDYCLWHIMVTTGSYISLDILELECEDDIENDNGLRIRSWGTGSSSTQRICKEHHSLIMRRTKMLFVSASNIKLRAKYSTVQNSCGGKLNSLRGFIASPLYPQPYPANIECIWQIRTSDTYIEINLMELDIRKSDNCNEDFLEVRNGEVGKLVGLFCGSEIPDEPLRLFEHAWIKFRSIDTGTGSGFKLKYNFAHINELNGTWGTIDSPPLYGIAEVEPFSWRILVLREENIQLDFKEYSMGLELYDGYDESGLSVEILPSPWMFTSSSNVVYLRTDNANIEAFKIIWQSVSKKIIAANSSILECQETLTLAYAARVNLSSPGYPNDYKTDLDCQWIVKTQDISEHAVIQLYEIDLEDSLDCYADYIKVWTSSDLEDWTLFLNECQVKGNMLQPVREIHGTPYLKVEFHSDNLIGKKGFTSTLTTDCGSNITSSVGKISHPNRLPFLSLSSTCLWQISVRPGRRISMNVDFGNTKLSQNSCNSYAIIYDGVDEHAPLLPPGRICHRNAHLESSSNQITVRFSDNQLLKLGFWIFNFTFREINTCNDEIRLTEFLPTVNISSPRYPNVPQPHTECNWMIMAPVGELLEAKFVDRFDLNPRYCNLEYVEFYDGSTSLARNLGKFCNKPKNSIRSTGNILSLHYLTEIAEPRNGFLVNISLAKCGGVYTNIYDEIRSKNYPELVHNPKSAFCDYTIRVLVQGSRIKLNFTDFDLPYNANKIESSDRLEIILFDDNSTRTHVLFGNLTVLPVMEIEANELLLRFYVFPKVNKYRGFKLKYTGITSQCFRTVNGESGQLVLKTAINVRSFRKCFWRITVPKGQRVNLTSSQIDVLNNSNLTSVMVISRPMITFYNDFAKLSKIADIDLSKKNFFSIISSDNTMYAQIFTDNKIKKLVATYSSEMASPCPDNIQESISGSLYLDQNIRALETYHCHIQFSLNGRETISFQINELEMVFDGLSSSYPVIFKDDRWNMPLKEINSNVTNMLLSFSPQQGSLNIYQNDKVRLNRFRANYRRHKCGGSLYVRDGIRLDKPDINDNEYGLLECVWVLSYGYGEHKLLGNATFVDNCEREYIEIYASLSKASLITKICRDNATLNDITLKRYKNMIIYHVENYKSSTFSIDLRVEEQLTCGSNTKVIDFQIVDVDAKFYKNNIECSWDYVANPGYYLSVQFTGRFFVEDAVNCTKDYLEIQIYNNGLWVSQSKLCGRELPQLEFYTSRLRAIFHTNDAITGDGFHMIISAECNVKVNVTQETQIIVGPFFLKTECSYEFQTLSNKLIHVEINGESGDEEENVENCDAFTAFTRSSKGIEKESGTYCVGSEIHAEHYLRLKYNPKKPLNFKISYDLENCGGNITTPTTVRSLRGAKSLKKKYCQWNIIAPPQHAVVIRFLQFSISSYFNCNLRYVAIYEGLTVTADKRIEKLCGSLERNVYIVNNNEAILAAMTDFRRVKNGFEAEIIFTINCNEHVTLSEDNTIVTIVQNQQLNATEERFCHYYVTAPEGYRVSFIIKSLNINNQSCSSVTCQKCNYIEIFDDMNGEKSMGKYCASGDKLEYNAYSSYESALIRLYVKDRVQYSFEISTHLEYSVCGGKKLIALEDFDNNGTTIAFPQRNMSTYPPNVHCTWQITSENDFEIDFQSFLLQNISQVDGKCKDYLYVKWSTNRFMFLCGNATGHQITIFRNNFFPNTEITFHSDQIDEDRGFNLTIQPMKVCDRIYTKLSDRITLQEKSMNAKCSFEIHVPDNYILTLFLEPCQFLNITVVDINKNETLQTDCVVNSMKLFTKTNRIRLEAQTFFQTINYIASDRRLPPGCGGIINMPGITFSNPPYNEDHNYSNCRWDLIVPIPNTVGIKFMEFDMGPETYCYLDHVQILEIQSDGSEKLAETLCGATVHRDFESSSNHIAIISNKSPNFAGIGWKFEFKLINSRNEN